MTVFRPIKIYSKNLADKLSSYFIIKKYLSITSRNKRKIIFGGHWSDNPGWLILNQNHQDITKSLKFPSSSVKAIFIEHVYEHINFDEAIYFLKEAKRILVKGGQIRIISPSIETILKTDFSKKDLNYKKYINNVLINMHYKKIDNLLKNIGLKGIKEDVNTFFLNSIFGENDHKFIWSANLLKKVLKVIGFKKVEIFKPGDGFNKEYCIERHQRGIYLGYDYKKDQNKSFFDLESLAVDAIK